MTSRAAWLPDAASVVADGAAEIAARCRRLGAGGARFARSLAGRVRARMAAPRPDRPAGRPAPDRSLDRSLAKWRRLGWAAIFLFLGGSVLWAATTRLDGAAIAPGVVAVESKRKTIQHLEGGIIDEILVTEGERVEAGQTLIRFDDTYPRATLDLLKGQYAAALALEARLSAERDGRDEIDFPDALLARADDPRITKIMVGQVDIFRSRRARIANQESIIAERIAKYRSEILGLEAQIAAGRQQLALLGEEIEAAEGLLARGLARKPKVLALKRKEAEISGDIGDYQAQIARAEESISELKLQLTIPKARRMNQVTEQLQTVHGRIADLKEKILAAEDVLKRTSVVALQSGTVVDLQVHTAGGVVQPGEKLLDLVPDGDRLVIEVRIDPRDIDAVYVGMPAQVRLTAFNARATPTLDGRVTSISADRVSDPSTGVSYFTGRVEPADDSWRAAGFDPTVLLPGMQAEVFLVTERRTVLDYLVAPISRSFARAGREQ